MNAEILIEKFDVLVKELESKKIPCKAVLRKYNGKVGINVDCGWKYPDSVAIKVLNAGRAAGIDVHDGNGFEVSAESGGGEAMKVKWIAGGPARYI